MKTPFALRQPRAGEFLAIFVAIGVLTDAIILFWRLSGVGAFLLIAAVILAALWYGRWVQRATVVLFNLFVYPAIIAFAFEPVRIAALYIAATAVLLGLSEAIHRLVQGYAASLAREKLAQARLQHIVGNSPFATYSLEIRQRKPREVRCTFITPNIELLTGFSAHAFTDDLGTWMDHIHPEDRGKIRHMDLARRPRSVEYRFTRQDGVEVWLEDTAQTMSTADDGMLEIIGQIQDVTDRKRAQSEIEESQRFIAQLATTIPEQVLVTDLTTHQIVYANRDRAHLAVAALGATLSAGDHPCAELHPDDQLRCLEELSALEGQDDDETFTTRLRLRNGDESWRELQFHHRVFKRDALGQPTQLLTVWEDVTEAQRSQRALVESQRLLSRMAEALPNIVYLADLTGLSVRDGIIYANRSLPASLGYPEDRIKELGWTAFLSSILHPNDLPELMHLTQTWLALVDGELLEHDYRLRDAAGTWHWMRGREVVFERDDQGGVSQVIGVIEDITAMRQAQEDLAASQHLMKRVAEAVPNVLYVLDMRESGPNQGVVFSNRSLSAQLGYPAWEAKAQGWDRFLQSCLHPEDLPKFVAARREWLALADGDVHETEFRLRDAAGEWHWMLGRHLAFERDAAGVVIQVIGLLEDITARKELQNEVRTERDFAQLVLNTLGQGVAVVSPTGVCEYLNPAAVEILGLDSPNDFLGMNLVVHSQAMTPADVDALYPDYATRPQTLRFDSQFQKPDGTLVDLLNSVTPRFKDGAFIGTVAVFSDVTERRAMERDLAQALVNAQELTRDAQAATQAKSQFLANMSHEIRTPMNAIIGLAELLQDEDMSTAQRSRVEVMIESGHSLLEIINDILDFSKIEAGRLELDLHDFNLDHVVEGAVELLVIRARAKGLQLFTLVDPAIPAALHGDAGRVRQILLNLLSNAVKFTNPGGRIIVRAELEHAGDLPARVHLSVEDTGIGIPPEAQGRLFQPFEQAEPTTTRRFGGTGLGLAIVKRLVEYLEGSVQLTSRPGVGTTVTITLPFAVAHEPVPPAATLTGRILVVEPEPISSDVMVRYATAFGLSCDSAPDPSAALARLRQGGRYDALVVGLWPDRPETLQLIDRLTLDPELSKLPCVVVQDLPSGFGGSTGDEPPALSLRRPIKRQDLAHALAQALEPRQVSQTLTLEVVVREPGAAPDVAENAQERLQVLLAEDNAINQKVALLQLEQLGYAVEVASNGAAALAAYQANPDRYALILMDCQMPVLDGFAATQAIREWEVRQPGRRHVHVIAMTANAMSGDREECLAAGMDDYLSKPVSRQALHAMLQRNQTA